MLIAPGTTDMYLFQNDLVSATGSGRDLGEAALPQTFNIFPPPPVGAMGLSGFFSCSNNNVVSPLSFLVGETSWTIEMLAYIPSGGGAKALLTWLQNGGQGCGIVTQPDGSAAFLVDDDGIYADAGTVVFDSYNYFSMTSDGVTRKAYLNNVLIGSSAVGLAIATPTIAVLGNDAGDCAISIATGVIIGGLRFSSVTRTSFPTMDPYPIPRNPMLDVFLRINSQTILAWKSVANAPDGNTSVVTGYKVYRSSNKNLESFDLVATITTTDLNGLVQTVFNETIAGYYAYGIIAFNDTGESTMTIVSSVNATQDLNTLN